MKLTVRARHVVLSEEISTELRHRLQQVFSRLLPAIQTVDVTITDINGPKGGADKQCRVRVRGPSLPAVVVKQTGVDVIATVAAAARRAEQVVIGKMARRRAFAPALAF